LITIPSTFYEESVKPKNSSLAMNGERGIINSKKQPLVKRGKIERIC
jgi:hypothetical protein